ncbi:MAG: RidA family protein [Pseudomonadota bacterium]
MPKPAIPRVRHHLALLAAVLLIGCGSSDQKTHYSSATAGSELPFSDAVLAGNTLYISGKGGFKPGTRELPDDPGEEARLMLEDFKATLAAADMTMEDLVYVTVYCPDLSLYSVFNEVYHGYFKGAFPARAFIGSGPLLFGMRFEMQGIAVR